MTDVTVAGALKTHSTPAAIAVILAGVTAALHIGKIPPAIPVLQQALGLTLVEAGFLLSMVQLAGMLLGVLLGVAVDGLGLRRSMLIGQLTLSAASLAGIWARAPADLLVLRAVEGLGFLLVVLAAPSLIRQLVPARQLPSFLGLWGAYMPAGAALALLCGPLFMAAWGWQAWWGLLGALSAAMALWLVLGVRNAGAALAAAAPAGPVAAASQGWGQRLRVTLASPGPWLVALAFAMYSSQWLAVIGFLPSVYAQAGVGAAAAGALTALVCAMNIIGNVVAGRLLLRGQAAQRLLFWGFGSMALTALLTFSPLLGEAPQLRYAAVLLFSAAGGMVPGTLFSLVVRLAPNAQTVSTTMGWVQQCSATGQFLGPPLVAWVAAQAGGWHATWVVTGAASAIGLWLASRLGARAAVAQQA
ncbi:CynX/NimT family MFS transporter [Pantoea sp. 18069]|uniref:MFS transporter n=1 Tax=Pantoea sp. 18069 TaxID=2681415 RepID=UPI00190F2B21|nr:MFS transporter [Pantoea sp. 18069]